jgi:hypothetical protein
LHPSPFHPQTDREAAAAALAAARQQEADWHRKAAALKLEEAKADEKRRTAEANLLTVSKRDSILDEREVGGGGWEVGRGKKQ